MKKFLSLLLVMIFGMSAAAFTVFARQTNEVSWPTAIFDSAAATEVTEMNYGTEETYVSGYPVKNVKAVLIDGVSYNGNPTKVFAYYGVPENATEQNKVPGVVLVHGGGGTAMADWVARWVDKGYAAISMYWCEKEDYNVDPAVPESYAYNMGPRKNGTFDDVATVTERENQWMYHAVADVILSNTFLRSLSNVDETKIGIHGISWGGIISSYCMGIDNRYAFAIPAYGSGYLQESKGVMGHGMRANLEDKMLWDPSSVLKNVKSDLPVMFINGDTDMFFSANITAKSAADISGAKISMIHGLTHGHPSIYNQDTVYAFADSTVKGGTPLAVVNASSEDKRENGIYAVTSYTCDTPLAEAKLVYNKTGLVYNQSDWSFTYAWETADAAVDAENGTIEAKLPGYTRGYYFMTTDENGHVVSSPYVELSEQIPNDAEGKQQVNSEWEEYLNLSFDNMTLDDFKTETNIKASTSDPNFERISITDNKLVLQNSNGKGWCAYSIPTADLSGKVKISFDLEVNELGSHGSFLELYNKSKKKIGAAIAFTNNVLGVANGSNSGITRINGMTFDLNAPVRVTMLADVISGKYTLYTGTQPANLVWHDLYTAETDHTISQINLTTYDSVAFKLDNLKVEQEFPSYDSVQSFYEDFEGVRLDEAESYWRMNPTSKAVLSMESDGLGVAVDYDEAAGGTQFAEVSRMFSPVNSNATFRIVMRPEIASPTSNGVLMRLKNAEGQSIGEIGYFNATTLYVKEYNPESEANGDYDSSKEFNRTITIPADTFASAFKLNMKFDDAASKYAVWVGEAPPAALTYYAMPGAADLDKTPAGVAVYAQRRDPAQGTCIDKITVQELSISPAYHTNVTFADFSDGGFGAAVTTKNSVAELKSTVGGNAIMKVPMVSGTKQLVTMKIKPVDVGSTVNHIFSIGKTGLGGNDYLAQIILQPASNQILIREYGVFTDKKIAYANMRNWFDLSLLFDTEKGQFTGWVGDKPADSALVWQNMNKQGQADFSFDQIVYYMNPKSPNGYLLDHVRVCDAKAETGVSAVGFRGKLLEGLSGTGASYLMLPEGIALTDVALDDLFAVPSDIAAKASIQETAADNENMRTYQIAVKSSDSSAAGVTYVNLIPYSAEPAYVDLSMKIGETEYAGQTAITEAGTLAINGKLIGMNAEDAQMIIAVYDGKALSDCKTVTVVNGTLPEVTVNIPAEKEGEVKIFLWKDLYKVIPFMAPIEMSYNTVQ